MNTLPDILKAREPTLRLPKRERTRRLLIASAIEVFSRHGVADATVQQIAAAAGMTTGTVYNHFRTKAEIVSAVALSIAHTVRQRRVMLKTGAEQMVAGCRRYLELAMSSPAWAMLVLDVAAVDPTFRKTIQSFVLGELRLGIRRREFSVPSEAAGLDLVIGSTMEAMRRIASGQARRGHGAHVTRAILRGLGVPPARARRIVGRKLPLFAP